MQSTAFVMSWDDGHPLDMRLAGLLQKRGFPATFYVPILNREGPPVMSLAELREIDSAFEIGSHTWSHLSLLSYSDERNALREIERGKQSLEQSLGHAVHGFCFPDGAYRPAHVALARLAGVRHARTITNFVSRPFDGDDLLVDTTVQFYPHARPVVLSNWLSGGRLRHRAALAHVAWRERDLKRRLEHMLLACEEPGNVFHLWGHSWEIDRCDGWRVLDEFLRYAADRVPLESRFTVSEYHRRRSIDTTAAAMLVPAINSYE